MFRRFVATWLMLSILGYGMAVAAGVHHESTHKDGHSHALPDPDPQQSALDQQADSDHCCHGIAHLIGLSSETLTLSTSHLQSPVLRYTEPLHSLSLTPSFRPPISA